MCCCSILIWAGCVGTRKTRARPPEALTEFALESPEIEAELTAEQFAALMGRFGQLSNSLSFFLSLLGFSYVVRRLGLPATLLGGLGRASTNGSAGLGLGIGQT